MTKRIFSVVSVIRLLLDEQGSYASTRNINAALAQATMEVYNHYLGRTDVTDGRPAPAYQVNKRVDRALNPFLREVSLPLADGLGGLPGGLPTRIDDTGTSLDSVSVDGVFGAPADCYYLTAIRPEGATKAADILEDHALDARLNCPITGPTVEQPIAEVLPALQLPGGVQRPRFRVYPAAATRLKYLVLPPEPKYVETMVAGVPTYNDAQSVDHGWGRQQEPDLIARALKYLGLTLRDGMMQQAASLLSQENQ